MNDTCNTNESLATPAVYMAERPEGYDITFEIPGAGKGDVDLHVDGRTLRLRTTKKPAEKPAGFRELRGHGRPARAGGSLHGEGDGRERHPARRRRKAPGEPAPPHRDRLGFDRPDSTARCVRNAPRRRHVSIFKLIICR